MGKMRAVDLYSCLEQDFELSICKDEWQINDNEYITENFKTRSMGLLVDNSDTINHVYTAVFPSDLVIGKIITNKTENALLFVHHPLQWDITKPNVFQGIPKSTLQTLKDMKISIYNLHVPLDRNSEYGTTVNLAKELDIGFYEEFYEYGGVYVGIIGKTKCQNILELKSKFEMLVDHSVVLYNYGNDGIALNTVALVAGGGNDKGIYEFLKTKGINTYITGIANARNNYPPSVSAHNTAKENKINILTGTHYSTEKFACIKMAEYFKKHGLPCEFISDKPCMEDM